MMGPVHSVVGVPDQHAVVRYNMLGDTTWRWGRSCEGC